MAERYPGYDVLAKCTTPSWNAQTRRVVDQRLAVPREPRFFTADEFRTLDAIAARITPQPAHRPPIPVAALIDDKLMRGRHEVTGPPRCRASPRLGSVGSARDRRRKQEALHGAAFHTLDGARQDAVLQRVEAGEAHHQAWRGIPPATFFKQRLLPDIVHAYWSHPTAWQRDRLGWAGKPARLCPHGI